MRVVRITTYRTHSRSPTRLQCDRDCRDPDLWWDVSLAWSKERHRPSVPSEERHSLLLRNWRFHNALPQLFIGKRRDFDGQHAIPLPDYCELQHAMVDENDDSELVMIDEVSNQMKEIMIQHETFLTDECYSSRLSSRTSDLASWRNPICFDDTGNTFARTEIDK